MRTKVIAGLALAVALGGCVGEQPVNESENVEEAAEALSSSSSTDGWAEEHLPQWRVFLIGKSYDGTGDARRWAYPPSADRAGQIVTVRAGDEENPKKWVKLELEQHWLHGDTYFQVLMRQHGLTHLDLLMIHQALAAAGDTPPPAPKKLRTMDCYECGPMSPLGPFGPMGGDDHTGPAPDTWEVPPSPPPPPPEPPRRREPSRGVPKPGKPDPNREEKQRAWSNGVRPGDPAPQPAPTDASYTPAPNERKETFKCEGSTYYGFKGGCVDFEAMSTSVKWALKTGLFLESAGELLRREVLHLFFHDGKGPECVADCDELAIGVGGLGLGAVMALCIAATRGAAVTPCLNGTRQVTAWVTAGIVGGDVTRLSARWCSNHVCEK